MNLREEAGRSTVLAEIRRLVARIAEENPTWGYTRIIENALIVGAPATSACGGIRRRPRLGGLLNYYERAA